MASRALCGSASEPVRTSSSSRPSLARSRTTSWMKNGFPAVISWTVAATAWLAGGLVVSRMKRATSPASSPRRVIRSHTGSRASAPRSAASGWLRWTATSR